MFSMTTLDALTYFLGVRIPFLGMCRLQLSPDARVLHIHCQTARSRQMVLIKRFRLAALDIGLEEIIVTLPSESNFVISLSSKRAPISQPLDDLDRV